MDKTKRNLAWHFVGEKLRDGRDIPPDGVWLEHKGPIKICESGLHYSLHPYDALTYAPGGTLCLVEYDKVAETQVDKGVCARRRIVARIAVTQLLWKFARMQALSVIHLWKPTQVVLDYLNTGEESLRDAARDAARGPAWDAARGPAWDAARDAAWSAARAAARGPAWDAARDAAWAGARAAAWDAARGPAWDAALASARDAARKSWLDIVLECFSEYI